MSILGGAIFDDAFVYINIVCFDVDWVCQVLFYLYFYLDYEKDTPRAHLSKGAL